MGSPKPRTVTCANCGNIYTKTATYIGKFCSKKCGYQYYKAHRRNYKGKTMVCQICGKVFKVGKHAIGKFCSRRCYGIHRRKYPHLYPTLNKKGRIPWNKGKSYRKGADHWNWQGGKSLNRSYKLFTEEAKELVKRRDSYKCQLCGSSQLSLIHTLNIHHIDYDKANSNLDNLICLCRSCHSKTNNHNRTFWFLYFKQILQNQPHRIKRM